MYCAVARALELVGERWTLLVVRELLTGPKRYADLRAGLPGIATNLLAERLRGLQQADVVRQRTLAPPAASTVYELTDRGRALQPVLQALGSWGLPLLGLPRDGEQFRLAWLMIALDARYEPAACPQPVTVALQVDGETLTLTAHGRHHSISDGAPPHADISITSDRLTFLAWATGQLSDDAALATGMDVPGGAAALQQLRRIYPTSPSDATADAG